MRIVKRHSNWIIYSDGCGYLIESPAGVLGWTRYDDLDEAEEAIDEAQF